MKRTLTAAALAVLISVPAIAEHHEKGEKAKSSMQESTYYVNSNKSSFLAATLIGSRVYVTEGDIIDTATEADKEWNDVGEINNIVISKSGKVEAVVLGVGGFLGIGEKDVAINMSKLKFVTRTDTDKGDYYIVVKSTKKELESAPSYKTKS